MADNDYNIIKPVEGLQNIAGLTGAKRREERKRRQNLPGEQEEERESAEGPPSGGNQSVDQENSDSKPTDDKNDRHSIDYCA
ncbi:MAG: hypothetical protein ACE5NM_02435 [Sedimentisphaerales bacterium]